MLYRNLDLGEIAALEARGCTAERWHEVRAKDPFYADRISSVHFSGAVNLGAFSDTLKFPGNVERPSGLRNCSIHQCTIGDNVYISDVGNLANYEIDANCVIENVRQLVVEGSSTFGNGTKIEVVNEGGGREVTIYDRLSSQAAYIMAMYRDRSEVQAELDVTVKKYVDSKRSTIGHIGAGASVSNCGSIVNVLIGRAASVQGAAELRNGTIASCDADPSVIGAGVIARDFVVCSGSRVEDGAIINKCFVGQGVRMGKQYSAENSAFFANCEAFHGEACSIFAGPYTVTHHKSSLLIAGLYSFYNAGSGTNQSNHMYKLGPVHQGILERGSKTGSFSYLLCPYRVGPFSVVLEKHHGNFDLGNLPFSYITVEGPKTVVTPAMNFFTVGTARDAAKWPKRDRRKDPDMLDQLRFEVLSPYVMQRVVAGIADLKELSSKARREQADVAYRGAWVKRLMLSTAVKYYEMAVQIFLGDCVAKFMESYEGDNPAAALLHNLEHHADESLDDWVDISGLLCRKDRMEALLHYIEDGQLDDVEELNESFRAIAQNYPTDEWRWFCALLHARCTESVSAATLLQIVQDWKTARTKLNNMILQDAAKEFDPAAHIGYGLDGTPDQARADFAAVRGDADTNSFVRSTREEIATMQARAEKLKEMCEAAVKLSCAPASV
jgi:hypothetical protein